MGKKMKKERGVKNQMMGKVKKFKKKKRLLHNQCIDQRQKVLFKMKIKIIKIKILLLTLRVYKKNLKKFRKNNILLMDKFY